MATNLSENGFEQDQEPSPLKLVATLHPVNQIFQESDFPNLSPPSPSTSATRIDVNRKGWSQTLFPEQKPAPIFKLQFIPPVTRKENVFGVCPREAVEGELALLDLTLVGFFLGRRPSFSFVKAALLRQWKLRGHVEILQLLQGGYAFRFSDLRDRDHILDGNVFFVGGQPMFIRKWERSMHTGGILGLRKVPLWVSLPGLPLHLWGEEALSSIGSVLGTPLYSDRTTAMKTRLVFARICVEFHGDKPLLDSISIEDDVGMVYEQKVNYDWKPLHCLSCGVFGHRDCKSLAPGMEVEKDKQDSPIDEGGKHLNTGLGFTSHDEQNITNPAESGTGLM